MAVHKEPENYKRISSACVLICAAMALPLSSNFLSAQMQRTGPNVPQNPVCVQLFDVYSGLALGDADVEVTSDNGIQCKQAPCPTNGKTWRGRSDDSGAITIPPSAIQFDTYVKTKDHRAAKLAQGASRGTSAAQIELYPEWLFDEQHDWTRGYKLVSSHSGKILANTPVRIEFANDDWPAQHGGISSLDLKTNPLGYVFFSFLRKPKAKPEQTLADAPLADWMTPVAWAAVSGYGKAKLDYFDGSDDNRSVIWLQ